MSGLCAGGYKVGKGDCEQCGAAHNEQCRRYVPQLEKRIAELEADRRRLEWFLKDCVFDEIDGIDVHILACTIANQDGRDEPTDADYLIAYRQCIDEAMNNE